MKVLLESLALGQYSPDGPQILYNKKKGFFEPGITRRILLTIPIRRREDLTVRIKTADRTIREVRTTLNPFSYSGEALLLLSRRADPGIQSGARRLSLAARSEALPVSPGGYSSISAVIIHDAPLNELSPQQIDALTAWVRGGGLLIITGGITRWPIPCPIFTRN